MNGAWRETWSLGLAVALHLGLLLWNPMMLTRSTLFPHHDPLVDIDFIEEQAAPTPEGAQEQKGFLKSVKDLLKASRPEPSIGQVVPPVSRPRPAPLEFSGPVPRSEPTEELLSTNQPEGHIQLAAQPTLKPATDPQLKERGYGIRVKDIPVEMVRADELSGTLPSATIAIPIGPMSAKLALERPPRPAAHPTPSTGEITASGSGTAVGSQLASLATIGGISAGGVGQNPVTGAAGPSTEGSGIAQPRPSFDLAGPLGDRRILAKVTPTYPEWAIAEGVGGDVQLYFLVNAQGMVQGAYTRVVRTCGHPRLDQWAIQALSQWRFAPSAAPGVEGETQWGMITFHFTLK